MIQDIGEYQFFNQWRQTEVKDEDGIYIISKGQALVDGNAEVPTYADVKGLVSECRYLFSVDDRRYFLGLTDGEVTLEGYTYHSMRDLRGLTPMEKSLRALTAQHLSGWYAANRFCGCCGAPMKPGTDERKMVCTKCGFMSYPRINPSVIVAITDGKDKFLMTKYSPKASPVSHYVLVAGFVEIGETVEQTVAREAMEEVGLKVKNIRYVASQPWGMAGNLMLGYICEVDGSMDIIRDEDELSDARWFDRKDIPIPEDNTSVTSYIIREFAEGRL